MKVPAALLSLALASAVVAQGSPELPECAKSCADNFLTGGIGGCTNADVACICSNKDFLNSIACCLTNVCDQAAQEQAVQFALGICKGAGVNDLPTAVVCQSAAVSSTGSAASTELTAAATSTSASGSETTAAPTSTGSAASQASAASSTSRAAGPRPTAAAGLGAIGGIVAAVALL
ncbi:hypothetical protein N657DRAFT_647900 [Parathielavia appendiculata]|uniref:CFEM domain-containing protein n=1 Tax=Parathielavia appendiculata TaxID=2587402 RepID=A0AAN6TVW1_9PEZI|nr:hypothetical protein N657DRAFT_647900 [Parathielavia appendiculata]